MENKGEYSWRMGDSEDLLRRFKEFCLVDLQLSKATLYPHLSHLRRFLGWLEKPIEELTVNDIRGFLFQLREGNPYTYSNMLKALRRFLRDFLGRPDLIQGFRFPTRNPGLKRVPNKDELRRFYEAIDDIEERAIFLLLASSGLRRSEALNLRLSDVDFEKRMLIPNHDSKTKKSYLTFYNEECEGVLKQWLKIRPKTSNKLFPMRTGKNHSIFVEARKKTGINISPQILREWFACEMGRLGVPDRYVDAFCGRVPRSVLARHYTDFSLEKLKIKNKKLYWSNNII
jgi:integrase